jgi:hypothetical protein
VAPVFSIVSKASASSAMLLLLTTENIEVRDIGPYQIPQKIDLVQNFKMGIPLLPWKGVSMSHLKSVCLWKDTASHNRIWHTTFTGCKIQSHVLWILIRNNKSGARYWATGFKRINQLTEMGQGNAISKHSLYEAHLSSLLIPLGSISIQRQMVVYLIRK